MHSLSNKLDAQDQLNRAAGPSLARWVFWFCLSCAGLIVVALGMLWASTGFESLGISGAGLAIVLVMVVLVSAMGVGLMALVFQSNRSGRDEVVYNLPTHLRDRPELGGGSDQDHTTPENSRG